jgi:hypothetical protein
MSEDQLLSERLKLAAQSAPIDLAPSAFVRQRAQARQRRARIARAATGVGALSCVAALVWTGTIRADFLGPDPVIQPAGTATVRSSTPATPKETLKPSSKPSATGKLGPSLETVKPATPGQLFPVDLENFTLGLINYEGQSLPEFAQFRGLIKENAKSGGPPMQELISGGSIYMQAEEKISRELDYFPKMCGTTLQFSQDDLPDALEFQEEGLAKSYAVFATKDPVEAQVVIETLAAIYEKCFKNPTDASKLGEFKRVPGVGDQALLLSEVSKGNSLGGKEYFIVQKANTIWVSGTADPNLYTTDLRARSLNEDYIPAYAAWDKNGLN